MATIVIKETEEKERRAYACCFRDLDTGDQQFEPQLGAGSAESAVRSFLFKHGYRGSPVMVQRSDGQVFGPYHTRY